MGHARVSMINAYYMLSLFYFTLWFNYKTIVNHFNYNSVVKTHHPIQQLNKHYPTRAPPTSATVSHANILIKRRHS